MINILLLCFVLALYAYIIVRIGMWIDEVIENDEVLE